MEVVKLGESEINADNMTDKSGSRCHTRKFVQFVSLNMIF